MKNKTKNLLRSVCTAFILLFTYIFSAYASFGYHAAAADEEPVLPTSGHLYYFSDQADSAARCQDFVATGLTNTYTLYYRESQDFIRVIPQSFYAGELNSIQNSYVIFEIISYDSANLIYNGFLEDFFQTLKNQRCKILFICSTDESKYLNFGNFLQYVDVHVKVDIFFTFMSSIFYYAAQDYNDRWKIDGTTFIIDTAISSSSNNYIYGSFFCNYLVSYMDGVYFDEMRESRAFSTILDNHYIKIFYKTGNSYTDAISRRSYNQNQFSDLASAIRNDRVYSIGASWNGQTETYNWLNNMVLLRGLYNENFPIYLFNNSEYSYNDVTSTNFYTAGAYNIDNLFTDYLRGMDMHPYDNVDGICDITHFPYGTSANGWLIDALAYSDVWLDGFQLNQDTDLREPINCTIDI